MRCLQIALRFGTNWEALGSPAPDAAGTGFVGSLPACPGCILVPFVSQRSQFGSKESVVFVFNTVFVTDVLGESTFSWSGLKIF